MKNYLALLFLIGLSVSARAEEFPAVQGPFINFSNWPNSELKLAAEVDCQYQISMEPGTASCGTVTTPAQIDAGNLFHIPQFSLHPHSAGIFEPVHDPGFMYSMQVETPDGTEFYQLYDDDIGPATVAPPAVTFFSLIPRTVEVVMADGSSADSWINSHIHYASLYYEIKIEFVYSDGSSARVRTLIGRSNVAQLSLPAKNDNGTMTPDLLNYVASVSPPASAAFSKVRATLTVFDDYDGNVLASSVVESADTLGLTQEFPAQIRMSKVLTVVH